jgi:hypothetical protein
MNRTWIAATLVALTLVLPSTLLAHAGHMHKALGTVTSVQSPHVEIKTTDGKTMTVMLDKETAITRGKEKVDASAVKVGERVSVDYMEEKGMMMAHAIKLGTAEKK